ncbi:MAG: hypothetical protein ACYTG5_13145 [Planctomycetota bacterium]|jgi:hypothetical protein
MNKAEQPFPGIYYVWVLCVALLLITLLYWFTQSFNVPLGSA